MKNNNIHIGPDGTYFDHEIYFKHQVYDTVYKIERDIEDTEKYIENSKSELKILIAMDSRLIIEEANQNNQDIHQFISFKVDEEIEWLQENYIKLYKLQALLDGIKYNDAEIIKEEI